jgi:hypothetical protein
MCLWYTQEWLESPHAYPDATTQWEQAQRRHPGDTDPPAGAPVFWTGGTHGYGHAAISVGGGRIRTIDQQSGGVTSEVPLVEISRDWGLPYAGWTEDIGGVDVEWLRGSGGGVLGMTNLKKLSITSGQVVAGDGEWQAVYVDDDGALSILSGPRDAYDVTSGITFSGADEGSAVGFRYQAVDDYPDDRPSVVVASYPVLDVIALGGDTRTIITWSNDLPDSKDPDATRKLRLFVLAPPGQAVDVDYIATRVLYA